MSTHVPGADRDDEIVELTEYCRAIATKITVLQAELVKATRAMQTLAGGLGGTTVAQYLAGECQLLPQEAKRLVQLASRLPELPKINAAFAEGRLSEGTVLAITRVATPETQDRVLELAENANADQLQRVLRTFKRVSALPPAPPPEEAVWSVLRDDGMWHLRARLAPERGAQVDAALRAMAEPDPEPMPDPGPDADGGTKPPRIERSEALVRMAQAALTAKTTMAGVVPERFLTVVHLNADGDGGAFLEDGGALEPEVAEQLWCESWAAAVLSSRGRPMEATSASRYPTPAMMASLHARDRGCRLCGATRWLHAHHVVHWEDGGPTNLANLILLCGPHHRALHRHHWTISGNPNDPPNGPDRLRFLKAGGVEIPTCALRVDGAETAEFAGSSESTGARAVIPATSPAADAVAARRRHNGDPLTRFALDCILYDWLDPPEAA